MWRRTRGTFRLVLPVAAPDPRAIRICAVPDLAAVISAAFPTHNSVGKYAGCTGMSALLLATPQCVLDKVKYFLRDNRRMVVLDIVLRNFSLIRLLFLLKEIYCERLLALYAGFDTRDGRTHCKNYGASYPQRVQAQSIIVFWISVLKCFDKHRTIREAPQSAESLDSYGNWPSHLMRHGGRLSRILPEALRACVSPCRMNSGAPFPPTLSGCQQRHSSGSRTPARSCARRFRYSFRPPDEPCLASPVKA